MLSNVLFASSPAITHKGRVKRKVYLMMFQALLSDAFPAGLYYYRGSLKKAPQTFELMEN